MRPVGPTVLVCGQLTRDRRLTGGFVTGGSVFYAAMTALGLGADVRVATTAGPDFDFDELGLLPRVVAASEVTTVFENVKASSRRRQRVLAASGPVMPSLLPVGAEAMRWRNLDVLHLAPVLGELAPRVWIEAVRARIVGLGMQGLLRRVSPDGEVLERPWREGTTELDGVTAVFLGEDDTDRPEELAEELAATVPIVVLTHAERGCEVHARGGLARVGVFPTRERDPTGAGDAFAAGFLLALAEGADEVEAARLAAAAGSVVVEGEGGEALSRMSEARERAKLVPVLCPLR